MASDVRALLGRFAETATDADVRRLEIALSVRSKFLSSDEKKAVVQRLSEERGLDPTGRIEELISQNKVMLFIKGTKAFPQCGFSNTVVRLIEDCTDDFETFDVLSDETVREGIKEYSSWPTIPQIYLGGEFIGGADIAIEMHESGELKDAVAEALAKPVEAGKNEPVWNFAQDNLSG